MQPLFEETATSSLVNDVSKKEYLRMGFAIMEDQSLLRTGAGPER